MIMNEDLIKSEGNSKRVNMENKVVWIINHNALPPSLGGLNRHYYFKKYLERKGYRVRIFTSARIHNSDFNMADGNQRFTKKDIDGEEFVFIKSPAYNGNGISRVINMMEFAKNVTRIWNEFKSDNPDVIYASSPDPFAAVAAQRIARKHGIPNIIEIRDLWPLSIVEYKGMSQSNPAIRVLYRLERALYEKADSLVFTFPGGKDYIIDKGWQDKVDLDKINYINNGVDFESLEEDICEGFSDSDLNNDKFKVVYCGSIREANNVGLLVDVASILKDNKNIEFLVFGDGTQRKELQDKAVSLGLKNIKFKGFVEKKNIPYILSKASLNVLTYKQASTWKYGGSQNKMFDYLAAGVPIITNIRMGYSILRDKNCGIECGSNDPADFAASVLKVYSMDRDAYNKMSCNARLAARQYDYKVLAEDFIKVIESV